MPEYRLPIEGRLADIVRGEQADVGSDETLRDIERVILPRLREQQCERDRGGSDRR